MPKRTRIPIEFCGDNEVRRFDRLASQTDRAFAEQFFLFALITHTPMIGELKARCVAACRSGAYPKDYRHCLETIAQGWMRFLFLPGSPDVPWLRKWVYFAASDFLDDFYMRHCQPSAYWRGRFRRNPPLTVVRLPVTDGAGVLCEAMAELDEELDRLQRPRPPLSETKRQRVAREAEAHEKLQALIAGHGLRHTKKNLWRDAEWYVRVCVMGTKPTQIRDEFSARDEKEPDLSTIKKAIDNFAVLTGLPPRPKTPFKNRPKEHRKQA